MKIVKEKPGADGRKPSQNLTKAERERIQKRALALRAKGWTYKAIAEECGVSAESISRLCNPERRARRLEDDRKRRQTAEFREWNNTRKLYPEYRGRERGLYHERYATDPQFKLICCLRARLLPALKGNAKRGSAVRDLGCSIEELRQHIERQFWPGMQWTNFGEWQIDHIRPLSSFDLTDRKQLLKAVNWRNLQPLWAADNESKNGRLDWLPDPLRRHPSERG